MSKNFSEKVLKNVNRSFILFALTTILLVFFSSYRIIYQNVENNLSFLKMNKEKYVDELLFEIRSEFFNFMNREKNNLNYIDIIYNLDKNSFTFQSSKDYNFIQNDFKDENIIILPQEKVFLVFSDYFDGNKYLYGIDMKKFLEKLNSFSSIGKYFAIIKTEYGLVFPENIIFKDFTEEMIKKNSSFLNFQNERYNIDFIKKNGFEVIILMNSDILNEYILTTLYLIIFFMVISWIIIFINIKYFKFIMKKPINSILSGIQNVNENISSKIYYYDEDEFKIIVDELNKLYSNIELSIKEIKRSEIEAKHSSEFKGQILKVLSHEIRTPLHSIIGFSDHIKRELKNEKSILVANTIKKSAKDLLKKFERLMERAKIESESASIKLNFEKNNLLSVIFENATKYESICRSKNIKFIFDNSDFDTNHVKNSVVDSDKLKKIFNELLDNAAKFTSEGYIKFIVKTTEENLKVIIKDTGIGIPSKDIYRLYEPFFHSENYLRRKYEGLGIGLGIVKYYVEIMGGDIFLKAEDVGTCVSFEIPLLLNNQKIENFNFEKEIQTFESKYFDIDYEKKDFIIVLKEIKEAYIKIHDSEDKTEIFSMLYCLSEKLLKFKFDALNSINLTLIQMEKLYSHQRNRFLYKELIKKFEIRKL